MLKKLDKTIPVPLYFQLKENLLNAIKEGKFHVGEVIPTEKEISEQLEISRTTVRQAITELVQEGWLRREKSKGTFVAVPKINQSFIQALGSFNEQMEERGHVPSTKVLEFEVIDSPEEVSTALRLKKSEKVIYIHRLRSADNEPIVVVKTYLPLSRCNFILDMDLTNNSLYSVLSNHNHTKILKIHRFIEAVLSEDYDWEHLKIDKNQAVQRFISVGYNMYDEPIEYSIARYRGDKNSFEIIISANK